MPQVIYTGPLFEPYQVNDLFFTPLPEGGFISPEMSEEDATAWAGMWGYQLHEEPIVPAPVSVSVKKAAAKKPATKAKGS
ncbi:hypothetical protein E0G74_01040 [Salmonella enterica]|nr:hypothetical protein [Salmonella enterica]ECB1886250.1 hypothetical protein [Salmonella enterica subsp. enterica serovar Mississippi]